MPVFLRSVFVVVMLIEDLLTKTSTGMDNHIFNGGRCIQCTIMSSSQGRSVGKGRNVRVNSRDPR